MSLRCNVLCESRDRHCFARRRCRCRNTDIMGNDPFILACGMGSTRQCQDVVFKIQRLEVNRRNEKFGSTALNIALYMGPENLVKYLVQISCRRSKHRTCKNTAQQRDKRADIQIKNKSGSSALILACGNEDCDPQSRAISSRELWCECEPTRSHRIRQSGKSCEEYQDLQCS